jgi:hypothetical protein
MIASASSVHILPIRLPFVSHLLNFMIQPLHSLLASRNLATTGNVNPQKAEAHDASEPECSKPYPSRDLSFSRLGGAVL